MPPQVSGNVEGRQTYNRPVQQPLGYIYVPVLCVEEHVHLFSFVSTSVVTCSMHFFSLFFSVATNKCSSVTRRHVRISFRRDKASTRVIPTGCDPCHIIHTPTLAPGKNVSLNSSSPNVLYQEPRRIESTVGFKYGGRSAKILA